LAERAGLSSEGISVLERGARRAPYRETLVLLMRALGLSAADRARLETAAARPSRQPRRRTTAGEAQPRRDNLPLALTSLHGRERELTELYRLLGDAARLVTLTGPGGVGKTRLAVEAALAARERFPDGVWFVDLAPLRDPTLVTVAAANALGIGEQPPAPLVETLLNALRAQSALLIFDNCEHVLSEAAFLAEQIIRTCARVRVLSTSREALRVGGELVLRVDPLALPAEGAFASSPAFSLFCDRAAAVRAIDPVRDGQAVATIVRRLDGLPLAVELAAARAGSLSPEQIAGALDARFRLLTTGSRTALPRQQTLRAALDWSHDLLAERERTIFRRCAVLAGQWTLRSAEAVCADDAYDAWDVAGAVMSLVEQSLVAVTNDDAGDERRFTMLDTTREYARERLDSSGEREAVSRRHAGYFRALAAHADADSERTVRTAWLRSYEPDLHNIRAALVWSVAYANDLELGAALAGALGLYFVRLGLFTEGVSWCEAALSKLGAQLDPALEGALRLALARLYACTAGPREALQAAQRAAALFRDLQDSSQHARALIQVGHTALWLGQRADADEAAREALVLARELGSRYRIALALRLRSTTIEPSNVVARFEMLAEALDTYRALGDRQGVAFCLEDLADAAFADGDVRRALTHAREAIQVLRHARSPLIGQLLVNISAYALASGEIDEACDAAREALANARAASDARATAWALQRLAGVAAARGDAVRGAALLRAAGAQAAALGLAYSLTEQLAYDGVLELLRATLGGDELERLMTCGAAWSVEHAVAEAMLVR
jgi:predicted ATPase